MDNDAYAKGLIEERRGYALAGRVDRVAQVDAELARIGAALAAPVEAAAAAPPEHAVRRGRR